MTFAFFSVASGEAAHLPRSLRPPPMVIYATADNQYVVTASWVSEFPKNETRFADAVLVAQVNRFVAQIEHPYYDGALMVPIQDTEKLIKGDLSSEEFWAGRARVAESIKQVQAALSAATI